MNPRYLTAAFVFALSALGGSVGGAQPTDESRWAIDVTGGPTAFRESYSTDCCGPGIRAGGRSFTLRAVGRITRRLAIGAELGETIADGWRLQWRMPVITFSRPDQFTPWLQVGAGAVSQVGECPQDGSRPGPGCRVDRTFGGQVAAGLRVRLASFVSLGGEIGYVRGMIVRERYASSQRLAITLRLH
ncbi:MAG: hypothetical protein SFW08_11615 [Gemmatimonadaceae bacterium]|nr:hypothetical protein [Gemmatimonadaceae bacterium]